MKDLIKIALDDAAKKLDKQVPTTKKDIKSLDISDVKPVDLAKFISDNNVPNHAYFDGVDDSYDFWEVGKVMLSWKINIPTTDSDKLSFKRRRFSTIAFKFVSDLLRSNGYKRVGYNTGLLKDFDDTTVYDMYINGDFDRLVKYYSLPFVLAE